MRRDSQRFTDIVRAADSVARYLVGINKDEFMEEGLAQDAILRQLTVAGEAAYKISREIKARYQQIARFRHRVVHDYFGFDLEAAWDIASMGMPVLRIQVLAILAADFPDESVLRESEAPSSSEQEIRSSLM